MNEHLYEKAIKNLLIIDKQEPKFMEVHLWMKIGEAYYKLE